MPIAPKFTVKVKDDTQRQIVQQEKEIEQNRSKETYEKWISQYFQ